MFEDLFKQFYFPLRTYVYGLVHSVSTAEDIVQDVFTQLWLNCNEINKIKSIKSYLFTTAHHHALNYLKRVSLEKKYVNLLYDLIEQQNYSSIPENDILVDIRESIYKLPDKTKRIFLLSRQYKMKNKDIASFLDIDIKTVEKHITKALQILRKKIQGMGMLFIVILSR